jgi:hypothetical protein
MNMLLMTGLDPLSSASDLLDPDEDEDMELHSCTSNIDFIALAPKHFRTLIYDIVKADVMIFSWLFMISGGTFESWIG